MSRPFKITLWILLGLFVMMLLAGTGTAYILAGAFHLVFGFTTHAGKVLPQVTVNWSSVGMMAACVGLSGFFGHRFCGWIWQANGRTEPWRLRWTAAGLALIVVMFGAGMSFTAVAHQTGWLLRSPEPLVTSGSGMEWRNASVSLKTIASAQADFRANDRDDNKINDFWRADIAGLYSTKGSDGLPIKLIESSVAAADDRADIAEKRPKAGYWFRALRYADEKKEVDALSRFAALAHPANPHIGSYLFLVTQENTIYRKPYEGEVPEVCPEDPLKDGWSKLD